MIKLIIYWVKTMNIRMLIDSTHPDYRIYVLYDNSLLLIGIAWCQEVKATQQCTTVIWSGAVLGFRRIFIIINIIK